MGWTAYLLMLGLLALGCFMMLIVLLQRGRGGGLVGALGGPGGQSAFGTRAGDVFTRITIVVATLWVVTAGFAGIALRRAATSPLDSLETGIEAPDEPAGLPAGSPLSGDEIAPIDTAPADDAPSGVDASADPSNAEVDVEDAEMLDDELTPANEPDAVEEVPATSAEDATED